MNDITTASKKVKFDKTRARKPRTAEADDLRNWLATIGTNTHPNLHVNGVSYGTAVVVVDFGTPLVEETKMTTDQVAEMVNRMRSLTKALYKDREVTVRVQNDTSSGVWYTSVA